MNDIKRQVKAFMITYQHFMIGAHLKKCHYPVSSMDDHEHCVMCGAKFSRHPEEIHEGYVTIDGQNWVCNACLNDYCDEYGWIVEKA